MAEPARGVWTILVHGGAKTIPPEEAEANRRGCRRAAEEGGAILARGGSAVAAAHAAIRMLEDDPTYNAGTGSVPNAEGRIEVDAAMMDGASLDIGAVAAVERLRNPIDAAVAMLHRPPTLLVGAGARRFAREYGVAGDDGEPAAVSAGGGGHDTVGCVAIDGNGHVAAATSTGGLHGTAPGRVGDAPLPGCGFYADDAIGAVALSGDGEAIARTVLAARIMQALADRTADDAAAILPAAIGRVGGEAGAIVIDCHGRWGVAHTSTHFALALASSRFAGVVAALNAEELKEGAGHG